MSIFFFKQKTAYEMRISDWSSDVCSSDLGDVTARPSRWHIYREMQAPRPATGWRRILLAYGHRPGQPSRAHAPLHRPEERWPARLPVGFRGRRYAFRCGLDCAGGGSKGINDGTKITGRCAGL